MHCNFYWFSSNNHVFLLVLKTKYLVLDSAYAKHNSNYFIFFPAGIEHQFGALCGCPKIAMEYSSNTYLIALLCSKHCSTKLVLNMSCVDA